MNYSKWYGQRYKVFIHLNFTRLVCGIFRTTKKKLKKSIETHCTNMYYCYPYLGPKAVVLSSKKNNWTSPVGIQMFIVPVPDFWEYRTASMQLVYLQFDYFISYTIICMCSGHGFSSKRSLCNSLPSSHYRSTVSLLLYRIGPLF